ncbi:hypothetical protein QWY31_05385 [Cytophagales bacterium LB-30]|uniref:Lipocalin-like domain-containing protein n=1 Tax=Shiella aurantiaca TaxID=3058365 RepID=A0ABT8F388_9BACT|nr:hypothetical protein [Shiella aurantiaca]MDN4164923.1 hypothetical protein [Shiella aurantiaca]
MKSLKIAALFLALVVVGAACKKKPTPTPEDTAAQVQAKALVGTWESTSITKDGDATVGEVYPDFTVVFTASADDAENITGTIAASGDIFESTNEPILGSGTWTFGSNEATLDVDVTGNVDDISVSFNTDKTQLTLSFTVSEPAARVMGLTGNYTVVLAKQ